MGVVAFQSGQRFSASVELVVEECCRCHMFFAMSVDHQRRRREDRKMFYCPDGHELYYTGETEAQRLRRELETERRSAEWVRAERDRAVRQRNAARGQVTRIKNRVAAGTCPCCDRKFQDLTRHMALAHPDFVSKDEEE